MSEEREELQFGDQGRLTERDWADVIDGEDEPFGPFGAGIEWRPKDRLVTVRAGGGRLVAAAGAVVASVRVGAESFQVVGIGSVIVTRSLRGRGLTAKLMDPLLRLARTLGPDRAMLFCRPELVQLYERFGFVQLSGPVRVDQPAARIEIAEPAMWRPLREGVAWPPGPVELEGLPF